MRVRLLTDREEAIILAYVESGEKREGFAVVKHRFKKQEFVYNEVAFQAMLLDHFENRLALEAQK